MKPEPIYTAQNCNPAYQLNWSYSVFRKETPIPPSEWLHALSEAVEPDGVRVLNHRLTEKGTSQFLLSTKPDVAPVLLVARVKGRLQHLVQGQRPKAFRRNYSLHSLGSTKRGKLDEYLAGQTGKHPMADPRVQAMLERYQIFNPEVDLSAVRRNSHAEYRYNLHFSLVNDWREPEIREDRIQRIHDMLLKASSQRGELLSRGAIVADHIHVTIGCNLEDAPFDVVLSYMNNLAHACGMKAILKFSCFVGTFGEYDLGVVPRDP